ncbi:MAG: O-antigen ligase domain-containing protein, partial [Proteobacteria bacterium]|nr:O-antigen ligase domain-containing protein [Pseudomonadota bacterium]
MGTASGYAEKDLDKITSGRSDIFIYDIETWLEHPLLGVGAGASPYFRLEKEGVWTAPHIELSRLLAEQ